MSASRISNELQTLRDKLREIERTVLGAVKEMEPFDFPEFEKHFIQSNPLFKKRKIKPESFEHNAAEFDFTPFYKKFPLLTESIGKPGFISNSYFISVKKLIREGRISTAVSYHSSYVSLKKFRGDVPFTAIRPLS